MQRYESYKPSGVKWLGDVPAHWEVRPGFTCFKENKDRNKGLVETTVLSLSYGRIVIKPEEKLTGLVPESFENYQLIKPGDIVIRTTDLQNDQTSLRVGYAKDKGMITSAYLGLRCHPEISSGYVFRLLESYDASKVFYGMGSGLRQNIDFWDFKRLPVPLPPRDEQDRIVVFLDLQTADIEAAIAKKRRLIWLLQEQKKVLRNQAVTKGMNPAGVRRDSGVPWIGQIPAHWKVCGIKRIFKSMDYGLSESAVAEGSFKYLNMGHIKDGNVSTENTGYLTSAPKGLLLRKNDILFNRTNSFDLVGKSGIYLGDEDNVTFASYMVRIRVKDDICPVWANSLMNSENYLSFIRTLALRSLNQANLNPTRLGAVPVPVPPKEEQKEIASYLDDVSSHVDASISSVEKELRSLVEMKHGLISACVMGKMKV